MKKSILLLIIAILFTSSAIANPTSKATSGRVLGEYCAAGKSDPLYYGLCGGIIAGVYMMETTMSEVGETKSHICLPDGTTRDDMMLMVLSFIMKNPEYNQYRASDVVYLAMLTNYPCPLSLIYGTIPQTKVKG